jgi:hypothetical protein
MKLSDEIRALQRSRFIRHPRTHRIDSVAWTRLEMMKLQALALERRLEVLTNKAIPEITLGAEAWVVFGD